MAVRRRLAAAAARDAGRLFRSKVLAAPAEDASKDAPRRIPLKQDKPFKAIRAHGRWVSGRILSIGYFSENHPDIRLGIRIPRRAGTAVQRNRLKRQLRALFRSDHVNPHCGDYLVIVKSAAPRMIRPLIEEVARLLETIQRKDSQ